MNYTKCCTNCKWNYIEGEDDCSKKENHGYCANWTEVEEPEE